MTEPSIEQMAIIQSPLVPMSIVACAGSGKTFTAVRRMASMRQQLGDARGRIALLSFSNVAVETFKREYTNLSAHLPVGARREGVAIDTLDAFFVSNVLRAHGHRTMRCDQAPFLLTGNEPFLANREFTFWTKTAGGDPRPVRPTEIGKVSVNIANGRPVFHYRTDRGVIPINNGVQVAANLAAHGGYTHELARYWSLNVLKQQPAILTALVRRYPYLLIDEAQDIGTLHQALIELLIAAGANVTLIGDPNQGIYEFMGATGQFLVDYGKRVGVATASLTTNYRSVPRILGRANALSERLDNPHRAAPDSHHGAFFTSYKDGEEERLITAFHTRTEAATLCPSRSAVLCRAGADVRRLKGSDGAQGAGAVKLLAQAATLRDGKSDYSGAFRLVVGAFMSLLAKPPKCLAARLMHPALCAEDKELRRKIWAFTRSADHGLPDASLAAKSLWHPPMVERLRSLLTRVAAEHQLTAVHTLGSRLSTRDLLDMPLIEPRHLLAAEPKRIRIDTVHQAKGESLDAVLYLASKQHASALLSGVDSELGRVGYVAITRARNLFWLAVPANSIKALRPALLARGFQEMDGLAP